jgi:hypothetical protein
MAVIPTGGRRPKGAVLMYFLFGVNDAILRQPSAVLHDELSYTILYKFFDVPLARVARKLAYRAYITPMNLSGAAPPNPCFCSRLILNRTGPSESIFTSQYKSTKSQSPHHYLHYSPKYLNFSEVQSILCNSEALLYIPHSSSSAQPVLEAR